MSQLSMQPQDVCQEESLTTRVPPRFWQRPENLRVYFDKLGYKLGVKELDDWYRISRQEVEKKGGSGLFRYYGTLVQALRFAYPEFEWKHSNFIEIGNQKVPRGYWTKDNLIAALDDAEQKLGIKRVEDWYSVALTELKEVGFPSAATKKELVELLSKKYPDYKWEWAYILRGKYGQQKRLERSIESLFPGQEIKTNVRREAGLLNKETGSFLELDIWLPSLKIAFEYQDVHHYKSANYAYTPLTTYRKRDELKQQLAKEKGITLVLIPYWWDGKSESLVATIRQLRPDIVQSVEESEEIAPIPETPPASALKSLTQQPTQIEGIGEPVTACFLTSQSTDPSGWWLFEKYDGVRGFWNPFKQAFFSRNGTQFTLPKEVVESMPQDMFLDGELWFGRDNFEEALKISGRADLTLIDWSKFKYVVFDVPNHHGTYAERYKLLEERVGGKSWPYLELATREVCKDMQHLEKYLQDVIDQGGEGIILRNPNSPYETGRSSGFLKHKKFRDAEAKIVGAAGAHQWECELPNGVRFTAPAGTAEFAKRWNPRTGDIVSFKHRGFLAGSMKPKFPGLFRVREDITWEDVVNNWKEKKPRTAVLPKLVRHRNKGKGHWAELENRKEFFSNLAAELGFDPLKPANWDQVTSAQVAKKGGRTILNHYKGSLQSALQGAFPELEFKERKKETGHWDSIDNRRHFFEEFAAEAGFDPTKPENWLNVTMNQFTAKKGGRTILNKYNRNLHLALQSTFPELLFPERTKRGQQS